MRHRRCCGTREEKRKAGDGMIPFQKRVRGVVLGTAYGDALGAVVEKLSFEQIKERYGTVRSLKTEWYKANLPPEDRGYKMRGNGIVTDDTLMTLALMRVYDKAKRHLDAYDLADSLMREIVYRRQYIPEFGRDAAVIDRLFYPEKFLFLRHVLANCEPREGGIGNMVDCGAAMYLSPVGVVNACDPAGAYGEAIAFACGHQCSYGLEAAGVLAACVAKAFEDGAGVSDLVDTALSLAKDGTKHAIEDLCGLAGKLRAERDDKAAVAHAFHRCLLKYSPMGDDVGHGEEKLGAPADSYTPGRKKSIEELPVALAYLVLHDGSFEDSMVDAVNSGRDTDSIGVMVGAILGAMYGEDILKPEDVGLLERANRLHFVENADRLCLTAEAVIEQDMKSAEKRRENLSRLGLRAVRE